MSEVLLKRGQVGRRSRWRVPLFGGAALILLLSVDPLLLSRPARARWVPNLPSQALSTYASLCAADPVAHYALGMRQRRAGDYAAALVSFGRASRLDPRFWAARARYGEAALELGDTARAYAVVQECLTEDGDLAPALVVLGRLHALRKQWASALDNAESALQLDGRDPDAWLLKARVRAARSEWQASADAASRAAILQPDLAGAWLARSTAATALGDRVSAIAWAERAAALRPDDGSAQVTLGRALLAGANDAVPRAEKAFREASRLDPASFDAKLGLATALVKQRRWREAVPLAEAVLRDAPAVNEARLLLSESYVAMADAARSQYWSKETIRWRKLISRKAEIERRLGQRMFDQRDHFRLSRLLAEMGLWQDALEHAAAGVRGISQPWAVQFDRRIRQAYAFRSNPEICGKALRTLEIPSEVTARSAL